MCPIHDPLGDKIMKDITRNYVNISSKGQEKVQGIFTSKPKRTTAMKQDDHGHRNIGRRTRVKDQSDEQVGEKTKQNNPAQMIE